MKIVSISGKNDKVRRETAKKLVHELEHCRYKVALWQKGATQSSLENVPQDAYLLLTDNSLTWQQPQNLTDFLPYLKQDILIIDDAIPNLPTLLCCENNNEATTNWTPFTIAAVVNKSTSPKQPQPIFQVDTQLAELVDYLAENLPAALPFPEGNPCCGACGKPNCAAFLAEIIAGNATEKDCVLKNNRVDVKINGVSLSLVKFGQDIVEYTMRGLLSTLNGYEKDCTINISIKNN